jgi:hypothetical protein
MGLLPALLAAAALNAIYDGRIGMTLPAAKLSPDEQVLFTTRILPAARKAWGEALSLCPSHQQPGALDIAEGSFTRPRAKQKAVLYIVCAYGHGMAYDGIAIIESGNLVAHVKYEGGVDRAIGALPDINGNGLSELLFSGGGTWQGSTSWQFKIIELTPEKIVRFGMAGVYEENCALQDPPCPATAKRISVHPGPSPGFFEEVFDRNTSENWKRKAVLKPLRLAEDTVEYEYLR